MGMKELMEKHDELFAKVKEFWKVDFFYNKKKYWNIVNELNKVIIEINKLNHCYWDKEKWIYEVASQIPVREDLTGNDLTEYVATELNKLNGVVLERYYDNNTLNYRISVITPYSCYHYLLSRGYAGRCNLVMDKFANSYTNKSKSNIVIVKEHICELIFESNLDELRTRWDRDILDK